MGFKMKSSLTKTQLYLLYTHKNPTIGEDLAVCWPCGLLLLLLILKDVWYVSVVSVSVGIVCCQRLTFFVCGIRRRDYGL
jgi:hypothetical protein